MSTIWGSSWYPVSHVGTAAEDVERRPRRDNTLDGQQGWTESYGITYYGPRGLSPERGGYREPPSTPTYHKSDLTGGDPSPPLPLHPLYIEFERSTSQPSETLSLVDEKCGDELSLNYKFSKQVRTGDAAIYADTESLDVGTDLSSYRPYPPKLCNTLVTPLTRSECLARSIFDTSSVNSDSTHGHGRFTDGNLTAASTKRYQGFRNPKMVVNDVV